MRVGIIDFCEKCGAAYKVTSPNGKYCPKCRGFLFYHFFKPGLLDKLEKKSQKNIMESSKVKIYGSSTYRPSEREGPYFERKDVSFLKQLIPGR